MTQPRFITTREGHKLRTQIVDAALGKPQRGVCVLLHGQTEFIEKYLEVIGELSERGFIVATLDWPGQGGSYRLLPDALKAHIDNFQSYDTALWTFMDQVVKPISDAPPVILAHSMGGHIALRAMHDQPNAFKCAVLSAPMLRALTRGYPRWLADLMCTVQNMLGKGNDWIWGMDQRDPHLVTFDTQLVTTVRAHTGFRARASRFASRRSHLGLAEAGDGEHGDGDVARLCASDLHAGPHLRG